MAAITTTVLSQATQGILDGFFVPALGNAKVLDLTLRLGKVEKTTDRIVNVKYTVTSGFEYVARGSAATGGSVDRMNAFSVTIYDGPTVALKLDMRDFSGDKVEMANNIKDVIDSGVAEFAYGLSYNFMSHATWDGTAYNLPMASIINALPVAATGTYYGVNRATVTDIQHFYSGTAAYGGGATAVTAKFDDAIDVSIRPACIRCADKGGTKRVILTDAKTMGYFRRYAAANNNTNVTATPAWLPQKLEDKDVIVGSIGYDTLVWENNLVVSVSGCTANTMYLVPFEVNGLPNVIWRYMTPKSGTSGKRFPMISVTDWVMTSANVAVADVHSCSTLFIRNLAPCAVIVHDGDYSA